MAQITIPDELIPEVLDHVNGVIDQWARAKIGPLVTKDTPPNLYQDLKLRAIEDSGFKVLDDNGVDLLTQATVESA